MKLKPNMLKSPSDAPPSSDEGDFSRKIQSESYQKL